MPITFNKPLTVLITLSVFMFSCITTYTDFPEKKIQTQPQKRPYDTLHYRIKNFPVLDVGGQDALHRVFRDKTPFKKTKKVQDPPDKGIFCLVSIDWKPLSLPALVFGYISVAFLTFLPAWSLKEGYIVNYHVYVDGSEKETFTYEITRKVGLWIVFLPFIWVNLITNSEAEAFSATAHQFFQDAGSLFLRHQKVE